MEYSVDTQEAKKIGDKGKSLRYGVIGIKYLTAGDYLFSVVISKKQGESTERNRVKRAIREIMLRKQEYYPTGHYLVYYRGDCKDFDRNIVIDNLDEIMRKIMFDGLQITRQHVEYEQPANDDE